MYIRNTFLVACAIAVQATQAIVLESRPDCETTIARQQEVIARLESQIAEYQDAA